MRRRLPLLVAVALLLVSCGDSGNTATTTPLDPDTSSTEATELGGTADASAPGSYTFVGADGVTSEIADTSRIVTLSGDLTEAVFALGMGANVVGRDVTTIHPPEALQIPIVGIGRFLTAEGVLAESPTLVLGDTQTAPLEAIEQIRSAGVPVVIFDVPTTFAGLYQKAADIGEVVGQSEEGLALAAEVRDAIEGAVATAARLEPAPGVAFVYSRGPDVMLLFGAGMTTQPMIEAAGGRDVGAASGIVGTVSVTPEAIVAAAPDVIVITQEGLDALGGAEGLFAIPGFAETPAGQAGRVIAYPEGDFLTFGPRIGNSLETFIADLRAEFADQ